MEKLLAGRYPPYTDEKMKKMQKLTGKPNPPFTHEPGSADRNGISGWVYAAGVAGVAIVGGIVGVLYKQKPSGKV
jgi:hypothetical protein